MACRRKRLHSGEISCYHGQRPTSPDLAKAEELFNKKYEFYQEADWTWRVVSPDDLQAGQCSFTPKALETLGQFKTDLNNLKDKLSDKDIRQWHEHTNFTNLAGGVIQACKQRFRPELCTQAWCKFYEIVSVFPLVCLQKETLVSVHLCEAPGAFVTSFNHYLSSQGFSGSWVWRATTLNPYYEGNSLGQMIDDDRFLRHSLEYWNFGVDNTGDLFNPANQTSLKTNVEKLGEVHLVTADGSIDCQNMPSEQEKVVSPLHYCETLMALHLLAEGGSFVIKLFTMFEEATVWLMYILNCTFKQVHVFKPATSKSGNSEVYVVCLQYRGRDNVPADLCHFLYCHMDQSGIPKTQMKLQLPQSFLLQHIQCCQKFMTYQGSTIERNLSLFGAMTEDLTAAIRCLKDYCTESYIEKYQLQQICFYDKVGKYPKKRSVGWPKGLFQRDPGPHKREGTFRDRHSQSQIPWLQRLENLPTNQYQEQTPPKEILGHIVEHDENPHLGVYGISVTRGRPLSRIQSSRFCDNTLLSELWDISPHVQLKEHRTNLKADLVKQSSKVLESILTSLYPDLLTSVLHVLDLSKWSFPYLQCVQDKYGPARIQIMTSPPQGVSPLLVYIDVTCAGDCEEPLMEEVSVQARLTESICEIFTILPRGSTVVFHLYTVLTRYTAGLLYLLYYSFEKVAIECTGSLMADLFVVCQRFEGCLPWYVEHLTNCLKQEIHSENTGVLEVIPITDILSADKFVSFLKTSNDRCLQSFISSIIREEKRRYGLLNHVT
ncbi:cap-specific mRNA (nucleoside-2'-O-)-methyltransferase 2-like [Liolophura sinensis]|uniref:cap-specific mRNA (nucleoside-2'-O-)-methyltransferase 2-like n=1 Tax=Liolophura sinensis TaxID=3198878 RepID=UPI003157FC99